MYNVYRCQVHHNIYHTYGDTTNTLTLSIIEYLAAAENSEKQNFDIWQFKGN